MLFASPTIYLYLHKRVSGEWRSISREGEGGWPWIIGRGFALCVDIFGIDSG